MPKDHEKPLECPECDGLGFHNGGNGFGVKCQCCDGGGRVTRGEIVAHDRRLDDASEKARKAQPNYTVGFSEAARADAHPFSGFAGDY